MGHGVLHCSVPFASSSHVTSLARNRVAIKGKVCGLIFFHCSHDSPCSLESFVLIYMLIVAFEYECPLSSLFQREMFIVRALLSSVPMHLARCQLSVFQEKLHFELMVEQ